MTENFSQLILTNEYRKLIKNNNNEKNEMFNTTKYNFIKNERLDSITLYCVKNAFNLHKKNYNMIIAAL